ncbi:HIT domain-containing protein [Rhodanobacter sp. DHB23]|uniref:HIT family protein n=1 Tax=Rhodanobacter sp. DHB23 TaxID=2775923 RepID=UPI00178296FF|nr:HIT domain-containing protein [Rhodanobacter sp. DHB23]MBD8872224.1 HIT domain-containing protein [Rhodanobacter sp. DHB23]
MSSADCPFCAIVRGELPASVILDEGGILAFMDLRQAVPGHVLVIPRRHVVDIYGLETEEAATVMRAALRIAHALRAEYDPPGLNLWQSNGEAGGQEVMHFHLHLHPRQAGDGLLGLYPHGPPQPGEAVQREAMALALRKHLA